MFAETSFFPVGEGTPVFFPVLCFLHTIVVHLSASKLVQYIKGNTSRKLQMEYKELNKQFWGQHLWARGYFVASSGNVTDEIIKEYIKNQDLQERNDSDNFEIG